MKLINNQVLAPTSFAISLIKPSAHYCVYLSRTFYSVLVNCDAQTRINNIDNRASNKRRALITNADDIRSSTNSNLSQSEQCIISVSISHFLATDDLILSVTVLYNLEIKNGALFLQHSAEKCICSV